jgi:hypothetical protein
VVDRLGRVVGIVTAGIMEANSINFAIKTEVALATLTRLAARCRCLSIDAPEGVPVFLDGVMVGVGPRIVIPADPGSHEVLAVVGGTPRKTRVSFPAQRVVDLRK